MVKLAGVSCVLFSFLLTFVELISLCSRVSHSGHQLSQCFDVFISHGRLNVTVRCRIVVRLPQEGLVRCAEHFYRPGRANIGCSGNIGSHKKTVVMLASTCTTTVII